MLEHRKETLRSYYVNQDLSNRDLHDYVKPGFLSLKDGFFMVLQTLAPLPDAQRANVLGVLCNRHCFFKFANVRLQYEEQLDCSWQLMAEILKLPAQLREPLFQTWVDHFRFQFQGTRFETLQEEMLASVFALPPASGRPLFEVYLNGIGYRPGKEALRQRALAHWSAAVQQ
jgi:hypothetical protein